MKLKQIGAAVVVAGALAFSLAACGSSTPVVTTVTATPTKPMHPALQKIQDDADRRWSESHPGQDVNAHRAAERAAASKPARQDDRLPWWAWMVIVPTGLIVLAVLGLKALEWNDDRTIARAEAKVDELDARAAARAARVLDYDEWEADDEEDEDFEKDEYPRAVEPPQVTITPAPPASGGSLLSSLRQQSQ